MITNNVGVQLKAIDWFIRDDGVDRAHKNNFDLVYAIQLGITVRAAPRTGKNLIVEVNRCCCSKGKQFEKNRCN